VCDCPSEQRLGASWWSLEQDVASCESSDEHQLDGAILA
jgi:hypothetical protein